MHIWLFEVVRISNRIKATSFERYESIYRNYIKDSPIYGLKLCNLKSIQIQRYYNDLYAYGKSSNSIKNLNKLLKQFLNYAVDEGYLIKNPCLGKKITIPGKYKLNKNNEDDKEYSVFTTDEIKVLKTVLDGHILKPLILLALGTGLRQGELLALKWSDINFKKKNLNVKRTIKKVAIIQKDGTRKYETIIGPPKSKSSVRTVPIPSYLVKVLKQQELKQKQDKLKAGSSYIESDFVFTTAIGGNIEARNLTRSYKRLLKKASIPYRKFHSLRHTYATKLFEVDVPLKTVQTLLGHSDITITADIYTHVMPEKRINAVEKLNDLFV